MTELRKNPRKIFKVRAVLAMDGQQSAPCRTLDISIDGVSLTLPHPVQAGQAGQVAFGLLVEGAVVPVQARCKVMYCMLSGGEFKAGFQFVNLPLPVATQLARFMR